MPPKEGRRLYEVWLIADKNRFPARYHQTTERLNNFCKTHGAKIIGIRDNDESWPVKGYRAACGFETTLASL